jgi:hypothetical protein
MNLLFHACRLKNGRKNGGIFLPCFRSVSALILGACLLGGNGITQAQTPAQAAPANPTASLAASDRAFAVGTLTRIAEPVLTNLAEGRLKATLPRHEWERDRTKYAPLEAFGRTLAGIAPWLELGPDKTPEGRQRARFIELSVQALVKATDPHSPDYMNFTGSGQPLVDTAFLAHGLLRAPHQLWDRLSTQQRSNVVAALKATRRTKPPECNWLLFSAVIEAALWRFTGECDLQPVTYAVQRHEQWYLGDGTYGDGPDYHWDYYNSYVIQPMYLEVCQVYASQTNVVSADVKTKVLARAQRYAEIQERMISPEGTFPVIGRSSVYRFGAFQLLADVALQKQLPPELHPAAVRSGLMAVVRRTMAAPNTFDAHGWLQVGAIGHQPSIREYYISTGSLYLCLTGLLPLGLPAEDSFWTAPAEEWTQKRIWAGEDIPADHAYKP